MQHHKLSICHLYVRQPILTSLTCSNFSLPKTTQSPSVCNSITCLPMLAPQCPAIRTGHTWLPEEEVTYKLNPHVSEQAVTRILNPHVSEQEVTRILNPHVSELVRPIWQHSGELQSPLGHWVLQRILRTPHVGIVHVAMPRGTRGVDTCRRR